LSVLIKVPAVTVKIFEYHHGAILFFSRLLAERDTFRFHRVVVTPEVICLQKKENSSAALIADKIFLSLI